MTDLKSKIPDFILFSSLLIIIAGLFTRFFEQILVSVLVLDLIFFLFWRKDHPPVILIGLILSWLAITIGHFYSAFTGEEIRNLLWRPYYSADNINKAFWYSIIGLSVLSIGLRLGTGKSLNLQVTSEEISNLDLLKLMIFFIIYVPLTDFLFERLRFLIPGISQFFYMLKNFKWTFFFLIVLGVFENKRYRGLFWIIFSYSIISGFASYFSEFKNYFYFLPIAYLTVKKLNYKQIIAILIITVFVYILGVYWSYIKMDYRMFLSGGKKAQVVTVSKSQALKKFFSYTKDFDKQRFKYGEEALIKRIFYLEYFSATIRYIPTYRPYMKGYNTMRAIRHVTMPRFLFPNKPPLDDSKHTTELTGIYVSTSQKGTSISTGYMAEFYADYGPFGMQILIFLVGLLWGWMYKFILGHTKPQIWGFGMTMPLFLLISSYGKDLTKLLGDTMWFFITFLIIRYTILPFIVKFFEFKEE